jgi:hypothetical protein
VREEMGERQGGRRVRGMEASPGEEGWGHLLRKEGSGKGKRGMRWGKGERQG